MKQTLFLFFYIVTSYSNAQSLNAIEFGTDSTLDIITWNIEWFPKNNSTTVDSVSKVITSLNADIIACQEIDDTVLFNSMLNNLPNYSGIYDPNNFEGLAYIYNTSTIQVFDSYSIYTNGSYWRPFPRAPYLLKAIFNGEPYILINNHLKCCGNGYLDQSDINDEENRRLEASTLLESYITDNFSNEKLILLGDLNDELTDASTHNVFQPFYDAPNSYQFVNQSIANGSSSNWSYPSWPSHLDHILITNELFESFNHPNSSIETIKVDDYLPNGFSDYDADISDHRPVGLKLYLNIDPLSSSNPYTNYPPNFTLYPNPASDFVSLQFNNLPKVDQIQIINFEGKIVLDFLVSDQEINIQSVAPGLYVVSLYSDGNYMGKSKLIIQ